MTLEQYIKLLTAFSDDNPGASSKDICCIVEDEYSYDFYDPSFIKKVLNGIRYVTDAKDATHICIN